MARAYSKKSRTEIGYGDRTDFDIANAVFMADRNSLDLGILQQAAKERIRWLSVQLAMATTRAEAAEVRCRALYAALTPSADTKAAYICEVKFPVCTGMDDDGGEVWADIPIPWDATKTTMAMILGYAALAEGGAI